MIRDIKMKINEIEKMIPESHQASIFSCKKYKNNGKSRGYVLFAYGNPFIEIFSDENTKIKYKWGSLAKKYLNKIDENNNELNTEKIKRILVNKCDDILIYYEKIGNNRERDLETKIANINSDPKDDSSLKIIDMEAHIEYIEIGNKKVIPDLIGIYKKNDRTIFNLIEYKCTKAAMKNESLQKHIDDFIQVRKDFISNYSKIELNGFQEYDTKIGDDMKFFSPFIQAEKEILILLSPYITNKNNVSYGSYIVALDKIKKKYKSSYEIIKVCLLENEKTIIEVGSIMNIEEAINVLNIKNRFHINL